MSETTRMLSSEPRSPLQKSKRDLQFYRADLTPGREGVAGADPETGNRFINEIHFANYFARKLADTLAMQSLDLAVVEDRDSQTAFSYSRQDNRWHGFITSQRLSLDEIRASLTRR